jgi:origin recognition complex subunit 2
MEVYSSGYNLLFYGVGSKKALLEDFANHMFRDGPVIVVNGYFPKLNIQHVLPFSHSLILSFFLSLPLSIHSFSRVTWIYSDQVLNAILERVLHVSLHFSELTDQLDCIQLLFRDSEKRQLTASSSSLRLRHRHSHRLFSSVLTKSQIPHSLYLLIHNIDSLSLRHSRTQQIFATLASIHQIHIIASFDHYQTPLLWNYHLLSQFNWVYHHVVLSLALSFSLSLWLPA